MSQSYMIVSQPTPATPPTLSFLSSPDSPHVTNASNTSPGHDLRQGYYPSSVELEDDPKSNHKSDLDLNALSVPHNPRESAGEHDPMHVHSVSKPVLETDGVVSSEVGDVPGILHQDLHPDGQPRRPMNAFMIFARHRRPVVQAKEPGLKTGEISKRLSHDWKNLPEEDKSHYLEQAKLLKDEFHSRFPEYVYKRRPNNTGKRRSSISQQQLLPKFGCGPVAPQSMNMPQGPMNGCMPHPSDIHTHHYHHHLHPNHGEIYHPGHSHHLPHHPQVQPPSRPLSSIAQHSSKLGSPNFYPLPNNPTSPRYHHIGHPSNCSTMAPRHSGPYSACGPPLTSTTNSVAPSSLHSPRPVSPVSSSSVTSGGMSYMRLPNPHQVSYPAQTTSNQYPWFTNDSSYGSPSGHHVGTAQTPLSASHPSFSYSSWPPSVTTDSHNMSGCGPNGSEDLDPTQAASHSRSASYSAGPPIYRAPSPTDRGRQLSLPSHSLTSASAKAPNSLSDSASTYDRLQHDHHSSPAGVHNTTHHTYGAYHSPDTLSNTQMSSYGAAPTAGGYSSNSLRNNLVSSSNGVQANLDTHAGFEHHQSPNVNQSSDPTPPQQSRNHFVNHCSPLHHPAPPPPPPAAATSHHHHQHSSNSTASVNAAASIAY